MTGEVRERIGLLVPSGNTVMEPDLYRRLPEFLSLHTARMFLRDSTPRSEAAMLDSQLLSAAKTLATARPSLILFGCTSASALRGANYERSLCSTITKESGAPALSILACVKRAIERRGARRVGVITPYIPSLDTKIRDSLESSGIEVQRVVGLGIRDIHQIALISPQEIAKMAIEAFQATSIDLIFASCTNFRALEAIPQVENRLGVPAISSNSAALEELAIRFGFVLESSQPGTRGDARILAANACSPPR